jgi:hypothetical protein
MGYQNGVSQNMYQNDSYLWMCFRGKDNKNIESDLNGFINEINLTISCNVRMRRNKINRYFEK